jgi:ABC-type sugar transport system ATPase subunit
MTRIVMGIDDCVLELRRVAKCYGPVRALQDASLSVRRGEIHGIVGQNGAGKSTMMQMIAGVHSPDSGEILLDGVPISFRDPDHARRLGIRIIYQELNLIRFQTVVENISLGIEPRTRLGFLDKRAMKTRAYEVLERLGHPTLIDKRVGELDVSEQQVVEIAKALAWDARLLILDEPTAALERRDVERLYAVLHRFKKQGGTALYVSHRLDEVFDVCDRVTVFRDGQIVSTTDTQAIKKNDVIGLMIGRPLGEIFPDRATGPAETPLLELNAVTSNGLRDISLKAYPGRILGVVGLEGSGIHELGRVLGGCEPVLAGDILVEARRVRLGKPARALNAGIVYLSSDRQSDGLFPILSVAHNIAIGTLDQRRKLGLIDFGSENSLVAHGVTAFAIRTPTTAQEIRFLSGGNQQKALLARCLAAKPRVFVLDEPTRGIDIGAKADIYFLVRDLAKSGVAVVMISADLPEILGVSDELLVLREGAVTARLDANVEEHEVLTYVL